jgi:hypothetical protein
MSGGGTNAGGAIRLRSEHDAQVYCPGECKRIAAANVLIKFIRTPQKGLVLWQITPQCVL